MKVLLVQAYLGRDEADGLLYPIAIVTLGTVLKQKGHEVSCIDPNPQKRGLDPIAEAVKEFQPDVVGISQRNVDTTQLRDPWLYIKTLKPTVDLIRSIKPEIKIVVGGAAFSLFAEKIVQRTPGVDFGIYLEGEDSLPELLNNLNQPDKVRGVIIRHQNGTTTFTGHREPPELTNIPMPDRDLVDPHPYFATMGSIGVETKRGCTLRCIYCSYPFLNGARIRQKTPKQIVDEVEVLKNKYDIPGFMFLDSVFNLPQEHAEEICKELIRRKNQTPWTAWFDMRNITPEFVELAKEAGCKQLSFSPDAYEDNALKILRKSFTQKDINETIKVVSHASGVRSGYAFFSAPPGTTTMGYLKMLLFFFRWNLALVPRRKGGVGLSFIRIEPYTEIEQIALKEGLITPETDLLPETEEDLIKLFYIHPKMKWTEPVSHFLLDSVNFAARLMGKKVRHTGRRKKQGVTDSVGHTTS
jgi:putative variant cofactor biosynthesis B12-binding/radical SAM domain protein 1